MNIVNKILQEWSLRSPDGLASGHTSEQNVVVLQQILMENEVDINDVNEVLGTILAKEAKKPSNAKISFEDKTSFLETIKNKQIDKKSGGSPQAEALYDAIVNNKTLINSDLASKYNSLTPAAAINYLNNNPVGQLFSQETNKITKMGLGRGEYALLFLIKGAVSGGTTTGDLIVGNEVIDVKEFDDLEAGEIKFPYASLSITRSNFYKNLFELASFVTKSDITKDYLSRLFDDMLNRNFEVDGAKGIKAIRDWISRPSTIEVSGAVFKYLYYVGEYFKNEKKEPDAETAALRFSGEPPKSMVIQEPEKVKKQILQPTSKNPIKMTVTPLTDELEQVVIPSLKNMDYFKENLTMDEITADLIKNIHYTGGIIYLRGTTYNFLKKSNISSKLIFTRLTQSSAKFKERK